MDPNPLATPMARRTVLGAAAATGLLAACGGSGDSSPTDTGTPADSAGNASGEALATTSEVPLDGGIINKDGEYVVTQPAAGQYRAFSSVCPHQQCQVGSVENNVIICPCHGSRFSAETGDVEAGPATSGLAPISVEVQGENIVRA